MDLNLCSYKYKLPACIVHALALYMHCTCICFHLHENHSAWIRFLFALVSVYAEHFKCNALTETSTNEKVSKRDSGCCILLHGLFVTLFLAIYVPFNP